MTLLWQKTLIYDIVMTEDEKEEKLKK